MHAWSKLARQYMRTQFVSHGNFIIASVIPVILCAPKFLAGEMTLGQVMQATAAFIQVQMRSTGSWTITRGWPSSRHQPVASPI